MPPISEKACWGSLCRHSHRLERKRWLSSEQVSWFEDGRTESGWGLTAATVRVGELGITAGHAFAANLLVLSPSAQGVCSKRTSKVVEQLLAIAGRVPEGSA